MALERFRTGGARGIARFLSDHQHCDAGFEVRRETEAGTGRLSITCKGCGEAITYKAAEAGELAAGPDLTNGDGGAPGPATPVDTPDDQGLQRVAPRAPSRSTDRSRLLPVILIGALILIGVVMIAAGLLRSGGTGRTDEATEPVATEATAPAETTPAEPAAPAETTPPADTTPAPGAAPVKLDRRTFEGRFAIGVPAGWKAGASGGAIAIAPNGDVAAIKVFFEPGMEPATELARGAARFLADEHEGADVSGAQPIRLGEEKGARVDATYSGGEESAVVLSASGYTFLVLLRVDGGASPAIAAEGEAALASFRAKN
jgi:hypothetical protein